MKKVISMILAMCLPLSLCACGAGEVSEKAMNVTATAADVAQLEALYQGRTDFHGDLHNHSDSGGRSDGKVELRLWPLLVLEPKEIDFAVIVDHRQSEHMRLPEWDTTKFIGGTEPQAIIVDEHIVQGKMHYNIIFNDPDVMDEFLKDNIEYKFGPDSQNPGMNTFGYPKFTSARFREVVQDILDRGGFFTHVHPLYDEYLISDDPLDYWFGDYTGFEVMTGTSKSFNLSHKENLEAYEMWVQLLNMDKILFATFGSDNHRDSDVACLSTIYAEEQNNQKLLEYVRKGDFTAGPVGIRMCIGDAVTGSKTAFVGKRLVIAVDNFHSQAMKSSHQYRLDLYNEKGLVFSQEFNSAEAAYFAIDAEDCKYYRANVYDVTENYIFAVGNPIWNG